MTFWWWKKFLILYLGWGIFTLLVPYPRCLSYDNDDHDESDNDNNGKGDHDKHNHNTTTKKTTTTKTHTTNHDKVDGAKVFLFYLIYLFFVCKDYLVSGLLSIPFDKLSSLMSAVYFVMAYLHLTLRRQQFLKNSADNRENFYPWLTRWLCLINIFSEL